MGHRLVFVVGAGASYDFGFPLGDGLANSIRNKVDKEFSGNDGLEPIGPLATALKAIVGADGVKTAASTLRLGMGPTESIDRFLFKRRNRLDVRELGKLAIADVILEAERTSQLNQFDLADLDRCVGAIRLTHNAWPIVLLDQLVGDRAPEEIDASLFENVAFLIFNYDRCVEHLLFYHLHLRHELPADQVRAILESIPMLHIYGVLGDPFEGPVPFGASTAELGAVAKRLQTYHEEITDTDRQAAIATIMSEAEQVCFLGFGFLPENFQRLFPGNKLGNRRLIGTAKGCESSSSYQLAAASPASLFRDCGPTEFIRTNGMELLNPSSLAAGSSPKGRRKGAQTRRRL